MRIIDRIALNRLMIVIGNFILSIIKLCNPKPSDDIPTPKPKRKKILPWRNK
jgi:hypothetical protein